MDPLTRFLGLDFYNDEAAALVAALLSRPAGAPFAYLVTPNTDHVQRLAKDPALGPVYAAAGWVLLDSRLLFLLGRRLGLYPPPVITGADLCACLLARCEGRAVAVVGMTAADFALLAARYPFVSFLHHQPPAGLAANELAFVAAKNFAVQAKAVFTFIALGSPLQERLAHAIAATGQARGIGLCIGSGLAFACGAKARAPLWMRRMGLEWLHRLSQEPGRLWRRYLWDGPVVIGRMILRAGQQKSR